MSKSNQIIAALLFALVLSLFAGCQAQNADVPSDPTEPSAFSQPTEPSSEPTEPSSEVTEPSSEATDPTETICPRTVEAIKPYITPYITYGEVRALLGRKNAEYSSETRSQAAVWLLEDGYKLSVLFLTTKDQAGKDWSQYFCEHLAQQGEMTDEEIGLLLQKWYDQMVAYKAHICRGELDRACEDVEELFDYEYKWGTEEAP